MMQNIDDGGFKIDMKMMMTRMSTIEMVKVYNCTCSPGKGKTWGELQQMTLSSLKLPSLSLFLSNNNDDDHHHNHQDVPF